MSGVALVSHHERASARDHAREIARWCGRHELPMWVDPTDAAAIGAGELGSGQPLADADIVVSLGGDGTMLRSVRLLGGAAVPLLGVNIGSLGYLTEIEPAALGTALERFFAGPEAGGWRLDQRMMLDVAVNGGFAGRALNEAVVEKSQSGHTVRLLARLDGEPFTHYAADGLIVSTPTGSTAYSMSARGPIVSPRHRAILLTPVAAHMLFDRTLVLDPTEVVEIEVAGHRRAELAIDGQPRRTLDEGDVVRCALSGATAAFVRFGADRYHQVLKSKFGLLER
jgi:NAD+ kinase